MGSSVTFATTMKPTGQRHASSGTILGAFQPQTMSEPKSVFAKHATC